MTIAEDESDAAGGPEPGEWKQRAEWALRNLENELCLLREKIGYEDVTDLSDEAHLAMAGDWAAIYLAATAAAGV